LGRALLRVNERKATGTAANLIELFGARYEKTTKGCDLSPLQLNLSKLESKNSGSLIVGLRVKVYADNQSVF